MFFEKFKGQKIEFDFVIFLYLLYFDFLYFLIALMLALAPALSSSLA